ncbi:MAG: hypothetical protein ACREOO_24160 [bacterium]
MTSLRKSSNPLHTDHFDIYFYPEEKAAAQQAARMAERWYSRHKFILQHELNGRQAILLYASHPQFEQTNALGGGDIGEGTGGVTEALQRRIVLPFAGPIAETDHVIGHELVHAFQYDLTGVNTGGRFRSPAGLQLPLWFIEGMAEFLSLGSNDPNTAMWMRDAVKTQKKLPNLRDLEGGRFFPSRYGQALLSYIAGRWGDGAIGELLKEFGGPGRTASLDGAIRKVLHVGPDTLAQDWHEALRAAYAPLMKTTEAPEKYGKLLISKKTGAGDLNVGPVLSPDGKNVIFFSEKDLFSIDLFLADAKTGKIKHNLVRAEKDPHLESLEFINSAGAWEAGGARLAFALVTKGRPGLALLEVKNHKITREIRLPHLGEIFNPTWSPDGKSIYFISDRDGISNIYRLELASANLFQVTNLYTGVSGITASSPALSVAQKINCLSFSVYENGKYNIYTTDTPEVLAGKPVAEFSDGVSSATLPPVVRVSTNLDSVLHNSTMGLSNAAHHRIVEYKPKLALTYIGQPVLAGGYDSYGVHLGGGISLMWSDKLGNRNLSLAAQAQIDGAERAQSCYCWPGVGI